MGASVTQAQSFYEGHSFVQGLIWWFVMGRIGQGLREQYEVQTELPPKLLMLVMRLDDSDVLFGNTSWQGDVDVFRG